MECNGNVRALERRDLLVKLGRRAACVALLAAVGFGAMRGYGGWRKQHLAQQAAAFAQRGDLRSAVLVARRLLELDSDNVAAARVMAEMAEKSGSAEAVKWREKVLHRDNSPANQLALVRCALALGQRDLAETVLRSIPDNARQGVEYLQVAGAEALSRKDVAAAEKQFAAAVALAPADMHLLFNLAALQLTSGNPATAAQARETLARLTTAGDNRIGALRALTADALAHKDAGAAKTWAVELKSEPGATISDQLLCLQAVENSNEVTAALAEVQAKAVASPRAVAEVITWLNRHGKAEIASSWSASLPAEIRSAQPVPLATAESLSFLEDWTGLRAFVDGQNWGAFEGLRFAVAAHALHRLGHSDRDMMQSDATWRAAIKAAQPHPEQLVAIAQLAEGWGYANEAADAWWQVANGADKARVALSALQRIYKAKQDTRGLLRVAKRALELNPDDIVAANNCASLGLLISSDSTARRLALKLHTEHPKNRAFAATYAYALHTEGKRVEALRVMDQLSESELRFPTVAAYYVLMLADSGKLERARSFLVDAKRATLLPEEKQLLDIATRKLLESEATAGVAQK